MKPDSRPGGGPVAGAQGTRPPSASVPLDDYDAELRLIAEQAQMLTLASGAAIALRQGELMVCRARSGNTAPALGARLDTQSGLSGECVRAARSLVCDDTENDDRVNLDVCRYLGIRSIAVLPICLDQEVVGVFEAFSSHPGGFSRNEVAALESMRDLVISVIRPRPQAEAPAVSATTARAVGAQPPVAPLRPPIVFDPDDDLLCEIEQRLQPKVKSDLPAPAPVLKESSRQPLSPPPRPAPVAQPDPDDDLICEIEMRAARQRPPLVPEPHPAHALSAFALAPPHTPEHPISRKLIIAGVAVALAGLMWLRWCNHAPQAASKAPPDSIVQAASTKAVAAAADATRTASLADSSAAQPQSPPAATGPPDQESSPAADTSTSPQQLPQASPPEPAPPVRATPVRARGHTGKPPDKKTRNKTEVAPVEETAAPLSSAVVESSSSQPMAVPAASSPSESSPAPRQVPAPIQQPAQMPPPVASAGASNPPSLSPPTSKLRPVQPTPAPPAPRPALSLSQAVVTAAPESASRGALSPDALRLLRDSATAGDAAAQLALAVRYANGDGVRQSYPEALKWFTRAQAQGVAPQGKASEAWNKVQQWAQARQK